MKLILRTPYHFVLNETGILHYDCFLVVANGSGGWYKRYQFRSRKSFKDYYDCMRHIKKLTEKNEGLFQG